MYADAHSPWGHPQTVSMFLLCSRLLGVKGAASGSLALPEIEMSEPLSAAELDELARDLPHPSLPLTLAVGSNVTYPPPAENARLVAQALALGLGRFRVSEHDHRLALERERSQR